jgi:Transglutaminase-like superfamily
MWPLLKFIQFPASRKLLLVQATLMLAGVRIALSLLPFRTLRRLLTRLAHVGSEKQVPIKSEIDNFVWALGAAGRTFPTIGTCLTQALAGYAWLASRGYSTDLRIGVNHDSDGKFSAHAWLQRGEIVVMGYIGREHERYTPFPAMRGLEPL